LLFTVAIFKQLSSSLRYVDLLPIVDWV